MRPDLLLVSLLRLDFDAAVLHFFLCPTAQSHVSLFVLLVVGDQFARRAAGIGGVSQELHETHRHRCRRVVSH